MICGNGNGLVGPSGIACLGIWAGLVLSLTAGGAMAQPVAGGAAAEPAASEAGGGEVKNAVQGNTAFALDLYAQLRTGEGNLAVSPYSISTALAMTYVGARGETAEQMAKVLHFGADVQRLSAVFAELEKTLKAGGGQGKAAGGTPGSLDVANALWGQKGERFEDGFLAVTKEFFGAGFHQLDFVKAAEASRKEINYWVAEQTRQKIQELLKSGDIDAGTMLVLTNAVYFKAKWLNTFNPKETRPGQFHTGKGETVTVPMMFQQHAFPWAAGEDCDVVEMPYGGERLAMVMLLPKKVDGLADLEKSLTPEKLEEWLGRLRPETVRVRMPRFKFGCRFGLADTLAKMGMADAFRLEAADFSGMNGRRHDLYISRVIHQVEMEVNEEGTEAAAATAVTMLRGAPPKTPMFNADHPFVFVIRDRQTGSILFMGHVVDPGAGSRT
jgi:serpin B